LECFDIRLALDGQRIDYIVCGGTIRQKQVKQNQSKHTTDNSSCVHFFLPSLKRDHNSPRKVPEAVHQGGRARANPVCTEYQNQVNCDQDTD
jgi:hypothetical protein